MKGGVFTIGFTEAISRAATEGKRISVNDLRTRTAEYITTKVDKSEVHHPQVTGNQTLAQSALRMGFFGLFMVPSRCDSGRPGAIAPRKPPAVFLDSV